MSNKIKSKNVKGQMAVLKVMAYKGCNVYIRRFGENIFVYDVVFEGQIYSAHFIINPANGTTKLDGKQLMAATNMVWAGAEATIDELLGVKLTPEQAKQAQKVIDSQMN